jgi:phosphoribosylformylglycinamidine synthase
VGLVEDEAHVTRQFAPAGARLLLLGGAPAELGGSQFLGIVHGLKTGDAPAVDLTAEKWLHSLLLDQIRAGRIAAAHDLSEGGLLVAVSEMLFAPAGSVGAALDLGGLAASRTDALLFGECQGRAIVAVRPLDAGAVLAAAAAAGVPADAIGNTNGGEVLSVATGRFKASWKVADLREGWETSIENAMRRPAR